MFIEGNQEVVTKQEHWRQVIGDWRGSGLGKAGFCRERGIPVWQFHYWCRRITDAAAENAEAAGSDLFARVHAAGGTGLRLRMGSLEIELEPQSSAA